jgi:hypothetical protein
MRYLLPNIVPGRKRPWSMPPDEGGRSAERCTVPAEETSSGAPHLGQNREPSATAAEQERHPEDMREEHYRSLAVDGLALPVLL